MKFIALLISIAFITYPLLAQEQEYHPGGERFQTVWKEFYNGGHEPELDDPLIEAGKEMTIFICEAIQHKDMKMRRYAIGALGFIGDERALETLEAILKSKEEIDYFRGDALQSIYQIDRGLGKKYAKEFASENDHLNFIANAIENDAEWLTAPTKDY